ncbi:sulfotransferase domain-containing protein [Sinomicrobium sp. M5D2P17]
MSKLQRANKILVTGVRRSGTTFVGKVLVSAKGTAYYFEPLSRDQGLKYIRRFWYPYFTEENILPHEKEILDKAFIDVQMDFMTTLYGRKHAINGASRWDLVKNLFSNFSDESLKMRLVRVLFRDRSNFESLKNKLKFKTESVVYKDPLASLSASYLSEKYGVKVIVMLKHPYFYYYSMKKQNWGVEPYANFYAQKSLYPIASELIGEVLKRHPNNSALYAITEYMLVYKFLMKERNNPNYYFVRLEDLASNPLEEFKKMFAFAGLQFSDSVHSYIESSTKNKNAVDTSNKSETKRDSKEMLKSWKGKVFEEEMKLVKDLTFEVVKEFYPEEEW